MLGPVIFKSIDSLHIKKKKIYIYMSVVIEKQEGLSIQYLIAINHGRNRIILSLSTFFFFFWGTLILIIFLI